MSGSLVIEKLPSLLRLISSQWRYTGYGLWAWRREHQDQMPGSTAEPNVLKLLVEQHDMTQFIANYDFNQNHSGQARVHVMRQDLQAAR